ncbi:response regulator [Brevundimonas sp.]|uniref:response regulator n=1 Tax=Brevundimonas sp. TaxID=1871086 RepID=UPI002594F5EA|nr:response regulator [Brevundimonas sp.]MDO9609753.1 response regulator [Brevundimonas sp.]
MPALMDGLTAVGRIRAWEAAENRPPAPVVMLTANTLPEHVSAALEAGADGHLAKPITVDRLVSAISSALSSARAPTQVAAFQALAPTS